MALKFLNKKGWHTGSLRNIENVWKAEQKRDAEDKKLDELRKQIHEERERSEFRQLQEQAGLIPRQERLDFLYESGLAVGKGSSDGFKALEVPPSDSSSANVAAAAAAAEGGASKAAVPGALFVDKPQSANDAWRKLHSDPLLLIRQREQEALSRIKNNPIRMAMIRKSVEAEKKSRQDDKDKKKKKQHKRKHKLSKSRNEKDSDSEVSSESEEDTRYGHRITSERLDKGKHSEYPSKIGKEEKRRKADHLKSDDKHSYSEHDERSSKIHSDSRYSSEREEGMKKGGRSERQSNYPSTIIQEENEKREGDRLTFDHKRSYSKHEKHSSGSHSNSKYLSESEEDRRKGGFTISERHQKYKHAMNSSKHPENGEEKRKHVTSTSDRHDPSSEPGSGSKNRETHTQSRQGPGYNRRRGVPKMTEEEREARLREMQLDAELHEEQRWKRVKKAAEADAQEAMRASSSGGKNFLDAAQKSIYGAEKGGSSTIEESVRRRAYFSQGGTAANESNAFRR